MVKVGNLNTLPFRSMCLSSRVRGAIFGAEAGELASDLVVEAILFNSLIVSFKSILEMGEGQKKKKRRTEDKRGKGDVGRTLHLFRVQTQIPGAALPLHIFPQPFWTRATL